MIWRKLRLYKEPFVFISDYKEKTLEYLLRRNCITQSSKLHCFFFKLLGQVIVTAYRVYWYQGKVWQLKIITPMIRVTWPSHHKKICLKGWLMWTCSHEQFGWRLGDANLLSWALQLKGGVTGESHHVCTDLMGGLLGSFGDFAVFPSMYKCGI